ncbi:MAG: VWA domain-containing protein [Rhodobacterales bacterium]|nr:VWA domain-containing protein [Rhodobacterales bacterium]
MRFFTPIFAALLGHVLLTSPLLAEGKSIIVLDASGSMWGQIDGRAKLEIAREALGTVLGGIDPATEIGLIAYGHREKGSCDDIELVVPPAAGTGQAIIEAANSMKFLGKTPLTEAVRRAAAELKSTEAKATVILITDGIETCEGDPCALGAELEASGIDFTANVVGFGLTEEEGKAVACLAENTGGKYIQAADAGSLVEALKTTVVVAEPEPVPEPTPAPAAAVEFNLAPQLYLVEGGPEIVDGNAWELFQIAADGTTGERITTEYNKYKGLFAAGTYRLVGRIGEARAELDVTLTDDAMLEPQVILNAGTLILHPRVSADGPIDGGAGLNLTNAAGMDGTYYGDTTVIVPAGETTINLRIGEARSTETVTLAAGETLEKDVIAGAGVAAVDAFYVDGVIMDTTQHAVEILMAKKALDGSQESITTSYGPAQLFTLPPGDYIARVTQGAATVDAPFTVKSGERVDVKVVLNAGVLAITAPGANSIEVLDAKADLSGNRKSQSFDYDESKTLIAPGGDYLIVVMRGEVRAEATATVKPGERTEITVP